MRVYIDESGDPGTRGSGSRALVLGCVMIADKDVPAVESAVQKARHIVGGPRLKNLHFKNMRHDDKIGTLNLTAAEPWAGVIVANFKNENRRSVALTQPPILYNYTARYLLERVTDYAKVIGEPAEVYFERSRVFDLAEFQRYMNTLAARNNSRIDDRFIRPYLIRTLAKGDAPGLDIADAIAYSAHRALEPNPKWGHYETAYLHILMPKLLRGAANGRLVGEGLVFMPTDNLHNFRQEYEWIPRE